MSGRPGDRVAGSRPDVQMPTPRQMEVGRGMRPVGARRADQHHIVCTYPVGRRIRYDRGSVRMADHRHVCRFPPVGLPPAAAHVGGQ